MISAFLRLLSATYLLVVLLRESLTLPKDPVESKMNKKTCSERLEDVVISQFQLFWLSKTLAHFSNN
jgi:hypothetical protein